MSRSTTRVKSVRDDVSFWLLDTLDTIMRSVVSSCLFFKAVIWNGFRFNYRYATKKKKERSRRREKEKDGDGSERVFRMKRLATAQFSVTKFQQRVANPIETNQRSEYSSLSFSPIFSLSLSLSLFFFSILGWRANPLKLRRRITRNIMPDNRRRRVSLRSDKTWSLAGTFWFYTRADISCKRSACIPRATDLVEIIVRINISPRAAFISRVPVVSLNSIPLTKQLFVIEKWSAMDHPLLSRSRDRRANLIFRRSRNHPAHNGSRPMNKQRSTVIIGPRHFSNHRCSRA